MLKRITKKKTEILGAGQRNTSPRYLEPPVNSSNLVCGLQKLH